MRTSGWLVTSAPRISIRSREAAGGGSTTEGHDAFGHGEVLGVDNDVLTAVFDDAGYTLLDRGLVADAGLPEVTSPTGQ